jgi:hypothetical protein
MKPRGQAHSLVPPLAATPLKTEAYRRACDVHAGEVLPRLEFSR